MYEIFLFVFFSKQDYLSLGFVAALSFYRYFDILFTILGVPIAMKHEQHLPPETKIRIIRDLDSRSKSVNLRIEHIREIAYSFINSRTMIFLRHKMVIVCKLEYRDCSRIVFVRHR